MVLYLIKLYLVPYLKLKPVQPDMLEHSNGHYCLIDIRDYIFSEKYPIYQAKNIPLSYLERTVREQHLCENDIIVITDTKLAAIMATRIINKSFKKRIYYYMV